LCYFLRTGGPFEQCVSTWDIDLVKGDALERTQEILMSKKLALVALLVCCLTAPVFATDHTVVAFGLNFTPSELTIAVGDTVTWVNEGGFHNVNAPGFFRCAEGCDGEGGNGDISSNPWSFTRTFDTPASIDYVCDQHIAFGMTGNVTVVDGGAAPALNLTGGCPGNLDVAVSGAAPNGAVAFILSSSEGTSNVPSGSCAGTELGLNSPSLLTVLTADANGEILFGRQVSEGNCGRFLQILDLASCTPSNVDQIP